MVCRKRSTCLHLILAILGLEVQCIFAMAISINVAANNLLKEVETFRQCDEHRGEAEAWEVIDCSCGKFAGLIVPICASEDSVHVVV